MKKHLTDKDLEKYVESKYGTCPFCESPYIEGDYVEIQGNLANQTVHCPDCNGSWIDEYKLVRIVIVSEPDEQ